MMSSKETKNKSRLYLSALLTLTATALLSTVTITVNDVFAQSDSEEDSTGNSDNVVDNGNAGQGGSGDGELLEWCRLTSDRGTVVYGFAESS